MSKPTAAESLEALQEICGFEIYGMGGCRRSHGSIHYHKADKDSETEVFASGKRDLRHPDLPMTPDTIVDVASITKLFTAAALMKLWDMELIEKEAAEMQVPVAEFYAPDFPDGIDTAISHFMPRLKERFPECLEFFESVEGRDHYDKINLRDLLNHTHGLGIVDGSKLDMISSKDPMTLSEVINATKLREGDVYGVYRYSNFGADFAAMIIETITGKEFDESMKDLVLVPYGLSHTYTQSDIKTLHEDESANLAKSSVIVGVTGKDCDPNEECLGAFEVLDREELHDASFMELGISHRVVTRASSNFNTTTDDLAKFARLFMGSEMFENKEVKDAVADRTKEVKYGEGDKFSCHLSSMIFSERPNYMAHGGYNGIFHSNLSYNVETGEVDISSSVLENVTNVIAVSLLREVFSVEECRVLKDFMESSFKDLSMIPREEKEEKFSEFLAENPELAEIFENLVGIKQDLSRYPIEDLMLEENKDRIWSELRESVLERKSVSFEAEAAAVVSPSPSPSEAAAVAAIGPSLDHARS